MKYIIVGENVLRSADALMLAISSHPKTTYLRAPKFLREIISFQIQHVYVHV